MPRMQGLSKPLDLQYEYSRQNLVARIVTMVVTPVAGAFCLIHLAYGNWLEAAFSALLSLMAGAIWLNSKAGSDLERSRLRLNLLFIAFIGCVFFFEAYTAAAYKLYSRLIWFYPIPLIAYFVLGRRIGAFIVLVFVGAMIVLLNGYLQQPTQLLIMPGDIWRFIAVFSIIGLVGFFMEREFRRDRTALLAKQAALERSESLYRESCVKLVDQINQRDQIELATQGLMEQVRQGQKMEALGQLAGGIAHDFNNLLGSMIGFIRMAERELPAGHPQKEKLSLALKAGDQAKKLLRRMLDFSRHDDSDRQPLYLGKLLQESLELVRPLLAPQVGLRVALPGDLQNDMVVKANGAQIQQVLFNLCQNASQAMAPEGGTLSVELCQAELSGEEAHSVGFDPGAYAMLMVRDNGPGMSPQALRKAFEPFFTTKGKGQGTGMGLFVSRAIVEAHGGRILAYSKENHGAQFTIYLPLTQANPLEESQATSAELPRGSGELVLYVDDEEPLTLSVSLTLRELGYRAVSCRSGEDALEMLALKALEVQLVICDYNMAGMSGIDLLRECRRLYPLMPVIITTGHAGVLDSNEPKMLEVGDILVKPVSVRRLAHAVHQAIKNPPQKDIISPNHWSGLAALPDSAE
jgi:signal transduction histidine kinase/CheY-like chemotaxis protein